MCGGMASGRCDPIQASQWNHGSMSAFAFAGDNGFSQVLRKSQSGKTVTPIEWRAVTACNAVKSLSGARFRLCSTSNILRALGSVEIQDSQID